MIKISFFSPSSYPLFKPNYGIPHGGAELQMFLLATSLSDKKKLEISFLTGNYGQNKYENHKGIKLIRSISLPNYENIFVKLLKTIRLFFILKKNKPDLIISTAANTIIGLIAYYSKILKIKHIHRTAHQKDVDLSWIKANGIKGKIYKYGLENANLITVQSRDYQELLQKTHNLKSEILKNGFIIKKPKSNIKNTILWVGRFQKWKNPDMLINLANKIPEEHFTMICPYNKKDKKAWEKLKQKAEEIKNVSFIEKVPFNEIQKFFNKAKLFINTSDFEGFPNTFLQAAQAKTPIVSLNVNPDDFLNKYNCGIFCANNFEKMYLETKNLIQNKKETETKGENAFKYLKENHDINIIGKKFENIIKSIL